MLPTDGVPKFLAGGDIPQVSPGAVDINLVPVIEQPDRIMPGFQFGNRTPVLFQRSLFACSLPPNFR
jgi:hypothetical protein